MATYKLSKANVAAAVSAIRADARFTPALQKEIGHRAGRPAADGSIVWVDATGGLFTGAVASGHLSENTWYDAVMIAHAD